MKKVLLGVYGGNGTTETAVAQGLEWLVKQQRADGMWSLSGPYSDHALADNPNAATAMALLAFQGAGITPGKGKYAKAVERGWTALLKVTTARRLVRQQHSPTPEPVHPCPVHDRPLRNLWHDSGQPLL